MNIFLKEIALLERGAFIINVKDQFNIYNDKCLDMTKWLKTTHNLIVNGLPSTIINYLLKMENCWEL